MNKRQKVIRWARYFNHYGHIPDVLIGGSSANRAVITAWARGYGFLHVRRQAKHRFGE